jgi:hypothetical protein
MSSLIEMSGSIILICGRQRLLKPLRLGAQAGIIIVTQSTELGAFEKILAQKIKPASSLLHVFHDMIIFCLP